MKRKIYALRKRFREDAYTIAEPNRPRDKKQHKKPKIKHFRSAIRFDAHASVDSPLHSFTFGPLLLLGLHRNRISEQQCRKRSFSIPKQITVNALPVDDIVTLNLYAKARV